MRFNLWWIAAAIVAFLLWRWYAMRGVGLVSTSAFNWTGNLPSIINPRVIVGQGPGKTAVYGPPATGGADPTYFFGNLN